MALVQRLRTSAVLALALAAAFLPDSARAARETASDHDPLPAVLRSSVQIVLERNGAPIRYASGVVVAAGASGASSDCVVVTAGHTFAKLDSADQVFALLDRHLPESVKARAEVVAVRDGRNGDLAVLRIRSAACVAARAGRPPSLGDPVWVVGFPHGGELTVARGIVSQLSPTRQGGIPSRFTIDASTSHGSSGAGVFESRTGGLIGLVDAFGTTRVPIRGVAGAPHVDIPLPGMTYVTPVTAIDEFLRAAGTAPLLVGRQ